MVERFFDPAFARGLRMERTRNRSTKLNRLRATRHPVSALRKEAAGPLSRDPEGRPHDLAPCTLEPWAELQRGRDGALAGRPPGPGAAPHAARHILVFSGLDRPVILERRLVSRQNECQSHRFLDPWCSRPRGVQVRTLRVSKAAITRRLIENAALSAARGL